MYLVDFIFDDIKLSDFGCMVGSAVTGNNDNVSMGSVISLNTVINHGSYISEIVNADYEEVYSCQFDIFKKPCGGYDDVFTDNEITWFMRWLNRKEYLKFKPIFDDDESFSKLYLMGTFTTVEGILIGGNVIGFSLTFTSNSPFGYLEHTENTITLASAGSFTIYDESEEIGVTYPKTFAVKCSADGDLTISNSMDDSSRVTKVANCRSGEIITLDCIHKVISSNLGSAHTYLYNDFNYTFPRLINTKSSIKNTFTVSLPCVVTLNYNPVRKVGALV